MKKIPLRRRDGSLKAEVLVDDADFEWLSRWRWCDADGYAMRVEIRNGKRIPIRMHRLILGLEPGDPREGDHKNRDTHDNRRSNLRIVSHQANMQNQQKGTKTSKHRGVSYRKRSGKWRAQVWSNGRSLDLGEFASEAEAAAAARKGREEHQPGALS